MGGTSALSHSPYVQLLSACDNVLVLVNDTLHVFHMGLHVRHGHGVHLQQHGILKPLSNFRIRQNLAIELFQLGDLLLVSAGPGHNKAAVAEVRVAMLAHALYTGKGAVFNIALVKGTHNSHAILLVGFQNLGLVGDGKLGLAPGHGLSGLGGGLIRRQLQLVARAHGTEQRRGQECPR